VKDRERIKKSWYAAVCGAATLFAAPLVVPAQTPTPSIVTLVWPGDNALDRLERRYGKVITYEDPIWVWRGELARNPRLTLPTDTALEAPRPAFAMPAASPGGELATDLANVLSAFHLSSGTRFSVQSSKFGLHVIPALVHDENGAFVPAKNLLDAFITVPQDGRTAYQHFTALCAAIAIATGVKVKPGINFPEGWEAEFGGHASFIWGASSETGREAIVDLLDRSATSMSWHLLCYSGADTLHDHTCSFNIREVPISITDANGKPKDTVLLFDRCGRCPPLPPIPQPQLPPQQ
jgi:hypothetical protein